MARAGIRGMVFCLAAASLLVGCVEGGGTAGAGGGAGVAASPAKKKSVSRDVEAPEVFETTDSALWDGRPSLGGIWVAAPEVTNPERAVMFNPATGKSVTGALFKRERENPGPRLQLSSDAAEALGILAGQPTEIRVTALRKAEVEEAAPANEAAQATADAEGDPAKEGQAKEGQAKEGQAKEGQAAAIASAALAAVDAEARPGEKSEEGAAAPTAEAPRAKAGNDPAAAASAVATGAAAVAAEGADAVAETPRRKTWKERRAEAKAAREARKMAAAEARAAAAAAEAGTATAAGEAPTATAGSAAVAPIESAPLDARDPDAVAGKPAPAPKRRTVGDTPAPAAAATADEPKADAPAPAAASGPARPIQVASFSKEDNARRAAEALAKIGITATPQKSEKSGVAVWGVIVRGDEAMLKKIKDAGFADAYFLK